MKNFIFVHTFMLLKSHFILDFFALNIKKTKDIEIIKIMQYVIHNKVF